jgi:hypothetical protein
MQCSKVQNVNVIEMMDVGLVCAVRLRALPVQEWIRRPFSNTSVIRSERVTTTKTQTPRARRRDWSLALKIVQTNVVKAIEAVLGIQPVSLNDALAAPKDIGAECGDGRPSPVQLP